MADKSLFDLDAEGRWRLAFDRQQWVVQQRVGTPCQRGSDSAAMRRTGWKAVSFIGGKKATLHRVLREKGVILIEPAETDSPRPDNARTGATHPLDGPSTPGRAIAPVRALSERSPRRWRNGAQDGDRASSDTQRVQLER